MERRVFLQELRELIERRMIFLHGMADYKEPILAEISQHAGLNTWEHQIRRIVTSVKLSALNGDFPAYPARSEHSQQGGWVSSREWQARKSQSQWKSRSIGHQIQQEHQRRRDCYEG